jgi:hypothetical protein
MYSYLFTLKVQDVSYAACAHFSTFVVSYLSLAWEGGHPLLQAKISLFCDIYVSPNSYILNAKIESFC